MNNPKLRVIVDLIWATDFAYMGDRISVVRACENIDHAGQLLEKTKDIAVRMEEELELQTHRRKQKGEDKNEGDQER